MTLLYEQKIRLSVALGLLSFAGAAAPVSFVGPRGGDWNAATNWSSGCVPRAADDVVLDGASVKAVGSLSARSLTLRGQAKLHVVARPLADTSVFASPDKLAAALWKSAATVSLKGALTLERGSTVCPEADVLTGVPVVFRVGTLSVAEGASFNAVKLGWGWVRAPQASAPSAAKLHRVEGTTTPDFWTLAPGSGLNYSIGGNYAGAMKSASFSGKTYAGAYGLAAAPFLPGSPSGDYYVRGGHPDLGRGPGSIVIFVRGRASVYGSLLADADPTPNRIDGCDGGRPSGGGIWLAADQFSFGAKARLSACGGSPLQGSQFGPGGGGRVALAQGLTPAELNELAAGRRPAKLVYSDAITLVDASVTGGRRFKDEKGATADGSRMTVSSKRALSLVTVSGDACEPVGAAPGYGRHTFVRGEKQYLTVPSVARNAPEGNVRYACLGYEVRTSSGKVVSSGRGASVAVTPGPEPLTVVWKWSKPTYALRVTKPSEATLVTVLTNNASVWAQPLGLAGSPEGLGVEIKGETAGAQLELAVVDAKKRVFAATFPATDAFTLHPFDAPDWQARDGKGGAMAQPVKVASVKLTGGKAEAKRLRAAYRRPLGRAGRHFAAYETLARTLGGTVVATNTASVPLALDGSGVRLVLHESKGSQLELVWDDGKKDTFRFGRQGQSEKLCADFAGMKRGAQFGIPDSFVSLGPVRQYARPCLRPYGCRSGMVPMGYDYMADAEQLPGAADHINDLVFERTPSGGVALTWDGSRAHVFGPPRASPAARIQSARLVLGAGAEYALKPAPKGYDRGRFEVLDFAANPRAKAFRTAVLASPLSAGALLDGPVPLRISDPRDSADVAICHVAKGSWALEVDEYTGRSPSDGFGAAAHWRVPARVYVRAHVVFALDPDPKKDRILHLRLAHYLFNGSGMNMIGDRRLDFSRGLPDDVREVGAVTLGGKRVPLYAMSVPLEYATSLPEAARGGTLDFEFFGEKRGSKPDAARSSAFNVFAATLEAAPATLGLVNAPNAPCNVFTADEKDRFFTLRFRGERDDASCDVAWKVTDFDGRKVGGSAASVRGLRRGEKRDVRVDLADLADPGLYFVDVDVAGDGGATSYSERFRVAVVPPAGRCATAEASPYATWWFYGSHGSPSTWETGGPVMLKAGIRRSSHRAWPKEAMEKYSATFTGQCYAPSQREFDAKTGHFRPHGTLSGEEWFVTNVTQQIASVPYCDHIMIWHESGPRNGIPEEILDLPVPPATEDDKAAGAYVNEIGRLVRRHFPKLRIQIGNNSASLGAACRPLRGGADPQYYDSVGIETPSQTMMPERLLVWGLQGMMMTKEAASYYAKRPVPAAACYEYVYRTERAIGEETQAAWYMRDVLISLANRMPMISPAVFFDVRTAYYDTLWGKAGMLLRAPYGEPKLSYVAYAALTKALDGVTLVKELDTGSTTVYALLFRRCDGTYATAVWTARGEAELKVDVSGDGTVMDMVGKVTKLGGFFSGKRVTASERPSYILTEKPVDGLAIAKRAFRQAEAAAKAAKSVYRFADATSVSNAPDARIKSRGTGCLPIMRPSDHFSVKAVKDGEKGDCLELTLDTTAEKVNRYYTEYTTLRLREPAVVPAKSKAIGVWVKGNSSWGQVRFEITDADGDVFVNYAHPSLWDTLDWQGMLCVNFDGWAFVNCCLPGGPGLVYDREKGLRNSPWSRETGAKGSNGRFDLPAKVTAVTVGVNRMKLDLVDFKPTDPHVRLGEICVETDVASSPNQ